MSNGKPLYCSFCGKTQSDVKKLIAGPSVMICNECVDLCFDIIHGDGSADQIVSRETGDQADEPPKLLP